jgi:outer membrane protein assembly factor BamA
MDRGRTGGLLLALVFFLLPGLTEALTLPDLSSADQKEEKKDAADKKNSAILVLPTISYTPETHWAFGVAALSYFRVSKDKSIDRPSNFSAEANYTEKKQFSLQLEPDLYFRGGYHLKGLFRYSDFPDRFYGIGNATTADLREDYTSRYRRINFEALKNVYRALNLGFQYYYENTAIIKTLEGGALASGTVPGSSGGRVSGLGYLMTWDSRDSIFFPTKGGFHQVAETVFSRTLGSDFAFSRFYLDLRKYYSLGAARSLGLQARALLETGNPPFWRMGLLGGNDIMRGYYAGRFRDRNLVCWQVEYRWVPVVWKLGVVGFLGFGDVADRVRNFKLEDFKYSCGFGLRYIFNREQKFNIRLDVGFGKGTSGVYITGGEAF